MVGPRAFQFHAQAVYFRFFMGGGFLNAVRFGNKRFFPRGEIFFQFAAVFPVFFARPVRVG